MVTAGEELRRLQEAAWRKRGIDPSEFDFTAALKNFAEQVANRTNDSFGPMPSSVVVTQEDVDLYAAWMSDISKNFSDNIDEDVASLARDFPLEEPVLYLKLRKIFSNAVSQFSLHDVNLPNIYFGTIADSAVNAFAFSPGVQMGFGVAFNRGLARFVNEILRAKYFILMEISGRDPAQYAVEARQIIKSNDGLGEYIARFMIRHLYLGRFQKLAKSDIKINFGLLLDKEHMLESMEMFVISHELSHIAFGHCGDSGVNVDSKLLADIMNYSVSVCSKIGNSYVDEVASDILGGYMTYDYYTRKFSEKKMPLTIAIRAFEAVSMLFYVFQHIGLILRRLPVQGVAMDSGKHPPPAFRRKYIEEFLAGQIAAEGGERVADNYLERCQQNKVIFDEIFTYFFRRYRTQQDFSADCMRVYAEGY